MPIDRDVMVMAISVVDCSVSQTYFSEQHNKMTRDQRYQLKLLLQNLLEAQHTGEEAGSVSQNYFFKIKICTRRLSTWLVNCLMQHNTGRRGSACTEGSTVTVTVAIYDSFGISCPEHNMTMTKQTSRNLFKFLQ